MTQTKLEGAKVLYKAKYWHSTLFGLLAGIFYLVIVDSSSIGSPPAEYGTTLFGAGVMFAIGFCAWQWRTPTFVLWVAVAVVTFATKGFGNFDWLTSFVVSVVMAGPFLNIEGLAFVENIFGTDKDDEPPAQSRD